MPSDGLASRQASNPPCDWQDFSPQEKVIFNTVFYFSEVISSFVQIIQIKCLQGKWLFKELFSMRAFGPSVRSDISWKEKIHWSSDVELFLY